MCRFGDTGGYEVGNVFIGLFEENLRDACTEEKTKTFLESIDYEKRAASLRTPKYRENMSLLTKELKMGNTNTKGKAWYTHLPSKKTFLLDPKDTRILDENFKKGRH